MPKGRLTATVPVVQEIGWQAQAALREVTSGLHGNEMSTDSSQVAMNLDRNVVDVTHFDTTETAGNVMPESRFAINAVSEVISLGSAQLEMHRVEIARRNANRVITAVLK